MGLPLYFSCEKQLLIKSKIDLIEAYRFSLREGSLSAASKVPKLFILISFVGPIDSLAVATVVGQDLAKTSHTLQGYNNSGSGLCRLLHGHPNPGP